jgi:hypothetical protein
VWQEAENTFRKGISNVRLLKVRPSPLLPSLRARSPLIRTCAALAPQARPAGQELSTRVYMHDEEVHMDAHVAAVGEIGLIRGAAHRVLLTAFDGEKEAYRGLRDAAEKDFRNQIGVKIQHHRGRAETILMKVAQESDKSVRALEKELHDVVISSWLRGNQGTVPSILPPFIVPATVPCYST